MRKVVISSIAVVLVTYIVFTLSCGETDPTLAPVGAIVTLNLDDTTKSVSCLEVGTTFRCEFAGGYWIYLLQALVQDTGSHTTPGDDTPGGEALNDVEIRFFTDGASYLYLQEDDISLLPPLAEPYYTETDERGLAWIKWVIPALSTCDTAADFQITADVGTAASSVVLSLICEAPPSDDDDDTS